MSDDGSARNDSRVAPIDGRIELRDSPRNTGHAAPARIRVHYPARAHRIVLRAEPDWQRDHEPIRVSADRQRFDFELPIDAEYRYFKPVLIDAASRWSVGENRLAIRSEARSQDVYPHFSEDARCAECELRELADTAGRRHAFRVFYPPGYHENTLRRYPVLYMHDGQNLFFPGETLSGADWRIADTLGVLDAMNAIEPLIVVGIYPNDRLIDYTRDGWDRYTGFLTESLKPLIDREYRTLPDRRHTATMGSSLGGVIALHLALRRADVFGAAACLSSTFGFRDDLAERLARQPRVGSRIYLDSGWPRDNYEVTRHMFRLLERRGWRPGIDLHYFCFPHAAHDERAWAQRAHLPIQLLFPSEN